MEDYILDDKVKVFFNKIKFTPKTSISFSKNNIILFFFFYIFIPIGISLTFFIIKLSISNFFIPPIAPLINPATATIGLLILIIDNNNYFWKNGFWLLIFFPIFQLTAALIGGDIFGNGIDFGNGINLKDILELIFTVIIIISVISFYLYQNRSQEIFNLKNSFRMQNISTTIIVVAIGLIVAILFNIVLSRFVGSEINQTSSNQGSIESVLKFGNIVEKITIIFGILIIAPIIEELLYRKTLAEIGNNKWWVIPISTIFFAFLHIQVFNDW